MKRVSVVIDMERGNDGVFAPESVTRTLRDVECGAIAIPIVTSWPDQHKSSSDSADATACGFAVETCAMPILTEPEGDY